MASGYRYIMPYQQWFDAAGVPLTGGLLNFYISGTDTRQNTYSDAGITVANANPVPADDAGVWPNIFLDPSLIYKVVLTDALGTEIWTADPVYGSGVAPGGGLAQVVANYTALAADQIIEVDASGGNRVIIVPLSRAPGSIVTVVKTDATANQVQISDGVAVRGVMMEPAAGAVMQSYDVYSTGTAIRLI